MWRVLVIACNILLAVSIMAQNKPTTQAKANRIVIPQEVVERHVARCDSVSTLTMDVLAIRQAELTHDDAWWGATLSGDLSEFSCAALNLKYWCYAQSTCDAQLLELAISYNLSVMRGQAKMLSMIPVQDKVSQQLKEAMLKCEMLTRHWVDDWCKALPDLCLGEN